MIPHPNNAVGESQNTKKDEFPIAAKAEINSHIEIAKAFAVTMALFAAVQISFAQIITSKGETSNTAKWDALYIFTYGSILFNLGGSAGAITVLYQATALENIWRNLPANRKKKPNQTESELLNYGVDWNLLRNCGMSRYYQVYFTTLILFFVLGCICIFASFSLWLCIWYRPAVSAVLVPSAFLVFLFSVSFLFLPKQ